MKPRLFSIFVVIVLMLSTIIGSVSARGVDNPPTPPAVTPHPAHGPQPPVKEGGPRRPPAASGSLTAAGVRASALTLGQPGTSFRYLQTFGVTESPYISDTTHLNYPGGLFMDAGNNLYMVENQGDRLLRYNSSGNNTLVIGKAGVPYTDDYVFSSPQDVALDSGGNIWVADWSRVVQYTPSGVISQSLPARNDSPWNTGNTNDRFDGARGIAFDSIGHMYVSDANNNRVQVFDLSTGSPVYSMTIGTGTAGNGVNQFSSPFRIAVNSHNDVYVVDNGNNRVQHCIYSAATWSCATLDSGLRSPEGITVDSSDNVYVGNTNPGGIRKCTAGGVCGDLVTNSDIWPRDLAVDSVGNVYASEQYYSIVAKYDSAGNRLNDFLGVQLVPYVTDNYHYNHPTVAVDGSNNIIIVEEDGQRLIKLNASGAAQWSIGVPGVSANDNTHLNWPHGVAVDKNGNIYVADNYRVQIFGGNGAYVATLGGLDDGTHNNYQFSWTSGIAVDGLGNIYVSDCDNDRVQIYNSSHTYVATLGVTATPSSDNGHLNCPMGVTVDSARNIYVADAGNNRVQKFNSSRVYQMTLGTPGPWGSGSNDFAHFGSGPEDIAADSQGRIYVADIWNNRVQVFDSSGAYVTTIGDYWGANTSQFRGTSGVDVDNQGNVYVADLDNGRLEKFALGVPGWVQKNLNGFGDVGGWVGTMTVFGNQMYAAGGNSAGVQIWRTADGNTWTPLATTGLSNPNSSPDSFAVLSNTLYLGTSNYTDGAGIYTSTDGVSWTNVVTAGFGITTNAEIINMASFNGSVYAGVLNYDPGTQLEFGQIWRSSDGTHWSNFSFGARGTAWWTFEPFGPYLYAGAWDIAGGVLYRTDGSTWTKVTNDGFGDTNNGGIVSLAAFKGYLYAGTRNPAAGAQVWRSSSGDLGSWTKVATDGFGDPNNFRGYGLLADSRALYFDITNVAVGDQVYRTTDGVTWVHVGVDGWGDSNNLYSDYSDKEAAVFNDSVYIASPNASGVTVWQPLDRWVFVPFVRR